MKFEHSYVCAFLAALHLAAMIINSDPDYVVNISIFVAAGLVCDLISKIKN